jgi:TolB-like protein/Tfp pilus assembly protein PilF
MSASPDIFLSYNREDQATARRFAEAFGREGFSVWWDATLRSGEAYDEVTENALRTAKAVVVLWSKKSVISRWVRAEATLADRNKTLVPAMIEPCDRPIMFELTQTANLSHWQGSASDPVWRAFLADVARFVERKGAQAQDGPATAAPIPIGLTPSTAPGLRTSTGERGDAPSLAVLPFTNRSDRSEDEVFAIGMVEDILDALSQGVYVRVIASAATARFRTGAIPDLEALSRQLGARYLLEGNVRRAGANLRVTAQLVDAVSGTILWTQRFDRPLTELAALQEQLVLEVAAHLNTQVYRLEMERALKKPGDLTAWEAVMRAIAAHRLMNVANMSLCVAEACSAVAIAPDYALAHAVLAMATGLRYFASGPDDMSEVRRIRDHVDRALALDPSNALVLAHVSRALSCSDDPDDGLRHGERAIQLNPGASLVHYSCGFACVCLNRPDEALAHFGADIRSSPGAPINCLNFANQGSAHIQAGRWDEALAAYDQALALFPAYGPALMFKALIYHRGGRAAEARESSRRAHQAEQAGTFAIWERLINKIFARSPAREELLRYLGALWAAGDSAA